MRLLTAVSLVRVQQGEPAKYSRNDTIRGYFFYAKSPNLGLFEFVVFCSLAANIENWVSFDVLHQFCTHLGVTRGSIVETRRSIETRLISIKMPYYSSKSYFKAEYSNITVFCGISNTVFAYPAPCVIVAF